MRLLKISLFVCISLSLVLSYSVSVATAGTKSGHHVRKSHKGKKQAVNSGNVWDRIRYGLRIPRPSPVSAGFDPIPITASRTLAPSLATSEATPKPDNIQSSATVADDGKTKRLSTVILPQKSLIKNKSLLTEKYTKLGKSLLEPKEPTASSENKPTSKIRLPGKDPLLVKKDILFKSSSVQRIRTRLGLHPELFKQDTPSVATADDKVTVSDDKPSSSNAVQKQITIRRCSDLNKKEVINSARLGLVSDYSQLSEQCRIKQTAIYQRVGRQIAGFSQSGFVQQSSERARPFLYHVVDALSKHGMPVDLALLPIVESGYQATALSPMSAAGIWQFIPSTGREYGLEQNESYDGRLDITSATQAAIRYLSGLNQHFKGDWLLSLAAYNCGQGTVDAAISRNLAAGLDTDYWSLSLPAETQDYVPRLLAVASIVANSGSYGLTLRPVKNEPHFIKVAIDRETDIDLLEQKDLATVAKLADFDPEEFSLLNKAYLKSTLTGRKSFSLLMPVSNANKLHESLAYLTESSSKVSQKKQATPTSLTVDPEMILFSTLFAYKAEIPLLALSSPEPKQTAHKSEDVKPTTDIAQADKSETPTSNYLAVHYMDKGETLKSIASDNGISEAVLRQINKLKRRQTLSYGQSLLIPVKKKWL